MLEPVRDYFDALKARAPDRAPLAAAVRLVDPLAGELVGREGALAFLHGVMPVLQDLVVDECLTQPGRCVVRWRAQTVAGEIAISEWFRVEGGEIVELIAHFDPRALAPGSAAPSRPG